MIRLRDKLWVGDSADGMGLGHTQVAAVLNVAQDLNIKDGWPNSDYMQVGLIDGPGNAPYAYAGATIALATLMVRAGSVLVCCHSGSRAMAVCAVYANIGLNRTWDECLDMLREGAEGELPAIHPAHREAFAKIKWKSIENILRP